jgi:hypothetical protein
MTVTIYQACTTPCLERRDDEDGCSKAAMRNKSRTLLDQRVTNFTVKTLKLATLVSQPLVTVGHTFIEQTDSQCIIHSRNTTTGPPGYL